MRIQFLVPGAMAGAVGDRGVTGAAVTDTDGNVIGKIVRVTSITSAGVEVEADITDPAAAQRLRG